MDISLSTSTVGQAQQPQTAYFAKGVGIFLEAAGLGALIAGGLAYGTQRGWFACVKLEQSLGFNGAILLVGGGVGSCVLGAVIVERYGGPKQSFEKAWEEILYFGINGLEKPLIDALKYQRPPPAKVFLFFESQHGYSDLFFDVAGPFQHDHSKLMSLGKEVVIFVCPQDEQAQDRWKGNGKDWWQTLRNSNQQGMKEFQKNVKHELVVLTCEESFWLNGYMSNPQQGLPRPIRKALGLSAWW